MRVCPCVGPAAIALVLVAGACYSQVPTTVLPAPLITQPVCGAVARWPDGLFTLAWESVEAASSYTVEFDCLGCGGTRDAWFSQSGTPWQVTPGLAPIYRTDVVSRLRREGGRTMRWRVWAVDGRGGDGTRSEWCVVAFSESGLPTPSAAPESNQR